MVANATHSRWDILGLGFLDDNDNNGIWDGLPGGYNEENDPHKFPKDRCNKAGDIKYEKFCVIVKMLTTNKEFRTDILSGTLKRILKDGAIEGIEKVGAGKKLTDLLRNLKSALGTLGKLDLITGNLAAKGFFSVGMRLEYRCCECPEKVWLWGDLKKSGYWLGEGSDEPMGGVTYSYASPSSLKSVGDDYKVAIKALAEEITETCPSED